MRAIVAVDADWGIGKDGGLLCHLSADLKRFKALTTGKPVILGRKTLYTFPKQKPLPHRPNLILTRDPHLQVEGAQVFTDLRAAVAAAGDDAAVIGGGEIYAQLLPYCDEAEITKLGQSFGADTFFPDLDADPAWVCVSEGEEQEEKGIRFRYCRYERVK